MFWSTSDGTEVTHWESAHSFLLTDRLSVTVAGEVLLSALILAANTLVIFVVVGAPALRTPGNYFVLSLTAADILSGTSIVFVILSICHRNFSSAGLLCKWRFTFLAVWWSASLHGLLAIALDRSLAILKPLRYCKMATERRSLFVIFVVWSYSLILGFCLYVKFDSGRVKRCDLFFDVPRSYLKYFVLNFSFVLLVIAICYCKIFFVARKQAKNCFGRSPPLCTRASKHVRTLALVVGVLFVCWMPVVVVLLLELAGNGDGRDLQTARLVACFFSQIGSAVNPIVYSFGNGEFRTAAKNIFCRGRSVSRRQTVPTVTTAL
ncbi:adenosine receptor A2b-like [Centruroides sculpturatus]|uniref:adenosine receptor A2b-like n=1 Tax=Centruroides sculpturatus TaxID=218467 RepID=UPI000C6EAFC1|nr:adenosine receptor A2b-like [Centruroides sculpturatus]